MKEPRAAKGGALRVLFPFDPRRHAILLLGGHNGGEVISQAELVGRLERTPVAARGWPG